MLPLQIHLITSLTLLLAAFGKINKAASIRRWALDLLYQSHQSPAPIVNETSLLSQGSRKSWEPSFRPSMS